MKKEKILKLLCAASSIEDAQKQIILAPREDKPPVVVEKLGSVEHPISASQAPLILGCKKKAQSRLRQVTDLSKVVNVQKGCLADDFLYFTLMGMEPNFVAKTLLGKYEIIPANEQGVVIANCKNLLEYLVDKEVTCLQESRSKVHKGVNFAGAVDCLIDNKVADFKYTARGAEDAAILYFPQLLVYSFLFDKEVFGIVRIPSFSTRSKAPKVAKADLSWSLDDIVAHAELLKRGANDISVSADCAYCKLCKKPVIFTMPKTNFKSLEEINLDELPF